MVNTVLSDSDLWGTDLSLLPGFAITVISNLHEIMDKGILRMTEKIVKGNGDFYQKT